MSDILAGFVLAAGAGTRLRPLTNVRPKALCPVGNVALVDLAIGHLREVTEQIAVNTHHHRPQIEAHLAGRVHLSVEEVEPLGTAGGLAHAREWIAGRDVLVVNVDAWHEADLRELVSGWDRERIRLLVAGGGSLQPGSGIVAALMPWAEVERLEPRPSGLYEHSWQPASTAGRLEVVEQLGAFVDCGTPATYLQANMLASGGAPVIAEAAVVDGTLERSVVWDTGRVWAGEHLVDAIRIGPRLTVLVR